MKQKGQAAVEFAFVAPMLIFLLLAVLYLGITFMDYIQYSNAARAAARDLSIQVDATTTNPSKSRDALATKINNQDSTAIKNYASPMTKLYSAYWDVMFLKADGTETSESANGVEVQVTISFERGDLPLAIEKLHLLPRELKPIRYKMRMELQK
ncbi:MAG: pilus assembly protein [Selenomonadaceae bacterium]|nr:pilus assembly protein [Selenomonadaceae bacterium]